VSPLNSNGALARRRNSTPVDLDTFQQVAVIFIPDGVFAVAPLDPDTVLVPLEEVELLGEQQGDVVTGDQVALGKHRDGNGVVKADPADRAHCRYSFRAGAG